MLEALKRLGWGIHGAGEIAWDFAHALTAAPGAALVHVAARRRGAAESLANPFGARASGALAELLDDPAVDAVYIATPHTCHESDALACIASGKPVLVEKPLAPSRAAVNAVFEAARTRAVVVREGYMYRCHPLLQEVARRITRGEIGRPRALRADFGFRSALGPTHRLLRPELAGGAIWDLGGYPVTLAQWLAGLVRGNTFEAPEGGDFEHTLGPTGVDVRAHARLAFHGGFEAHVACAIDTDLGTRALIFGDEGHIELPNPWLPSGQRQGTRTTFVVARRGRADERVELTARPIYALEAESFAAALQGRAEAPFAITPAESLVTSRVLECWRAG
jgi:predicted dehydrogenase